MGKHTLLFILLLLVRCFLSHSQNAGIGTNTPAANAKLDVTSTNSGILLPRMTTQQRNAIVNPVPGLMIFNTDLQQLEIYTAFNWQSIDNILPSVEKLLGGNLADYSRYIQQTTGGYIIAGYSASSNNGNVTNPNHGSNDYWILKTSTSGNIIWNKLLGGTGDETVASIQQTTDGGYIVAGYSSSSANGDVTATNHGSYDYWIVKLDGQGNIVWNKLLGGAGDDLVNSIQQTSDGGYIIAGSSTSSATGNVTGSNHGSFDYWVVKLDGSGNIIWNKLLGGAADDFAYSIQQTTDGGYIVAGSSQSSANGDVTGINHGFEDDWILKLDGTGNLAWNKLLGGSDDEEAYDIQQTTDGGYIIAGYSYSSASGNVTVTNHGNNDYWIIKLDGSGNIVWNKLFGGSAGEYAWDIQQTTDGGYVIAGMSSSSNSGNVGTGHGNFDYWIVKLDGTGNISWKTLLGGNGDDLAYHIQQTTDGSFIITGNSNSSANGDIIGVNHGDYDIWVVKLSPSGVLIR